MMQWRYCDAKNILSLKSGKDKNIEPGKFFSGSERVNTIAKKILELLIRRCVYLKTDYILAMSKYQSKQTQFGLSVQ